jgi:hypothetical protein
MRLPFHRPSATPQSAAEHASDLGNERSVAEAALGTGHPLVALLHQFDTAFEQAVSVTAVQAAGIVLFVGNHGVGLSLMLAAAAVQLGLGCRLAVLRVSRRELCLELILEGRRGLRLACLERECHRLLDPRRARQLARSIEEIVETAAHPIPRVAASRPLFEVRVVRPVMPELRQIASLLRGDCPSLQGVAAVERLLTSAVTPLYGSDVSPLRQELRRARYLLAESCVGASRRSEEHL